MRGGHVVFGFGDTLEKQLALLGDGDQLEFFRAIMVYGLHSEDTRFEGWKAALWEGMKDAIDNFGGSERGAPRGNRNAAKDKGESKQFGELNSIQNNSKTNETIQNNSPNDNDNDNEKEKKREKETSKETNRETDKVQEDTPFFLDSRFSEKEEEREESPETGVEAQGAERVSFHGEPPFDAAAPPSRSNAGVSDAPVSPAQDFASWFEGLRLHWNKAFPEQPYKKTAANLSYGKREDLMGTWRAWGAADCGRAVDNYKRARDSPALYDLKGCEYPSGLVGFLKNGVDAFAGAGAPDQFLRRTKEAARKGARARAEGMRREFDEKRRGRVRLYKEALERGCGAEAARILALDEEARLSFERRMEEVEKEAN